MEAEQQVSVAPENRQEEFLRHNPPDHFRKGQKRYREQETLVRELSALSNQDCELHHQLCEEYLKEAYPGRDNKKTRKTYRGEALWEYLSKAEDSKE